MSPIDSALNQQENAYEYGVTSAEPITFEYSMQEVVETRVAELNHRIQSNQARIDNLLKERGSFEKSYKQK